MAKQRYRPVFSDLATEAILALPRRAQRKAMDRAYALARYPFLKSDYVIFDAEGRSMEHLLVDEFMFVYWIDHARGLVMIDEVEVT